MRIIDGIPIRDDVYEIAQDHANRVGHEVVVGVEYHGPHGEAFFSNWQKGKLCRWVLGADRDELLTEWEPSGIIHILPMRGEQ